MIKILLGGSPCTKWSIAQKNGRETEPEGEGWELFKNYLIAKELFEPDFFLYENNKSVAKPIKEEICLKLSAPLQDINSTLVSAQNRQRFYVHNFGYVPQPEDRGITVQDILESGITDRRKAHCLRSRAGNVRDYIKKGQTPVAFEPLALNTKSYCLDKSYYKTGKFSPKTQSGRRFQVAEPVTFNLPRGYNKGGFKRHKTLTLTASSWEHNNFILEPVCVSQRGVYEDTMRRSRKTGSRIVQKFEARTDRKTDALTTVQKDNLAAIPVRVGCLGRDSCGNRLYSIKGKSVTITANGGGKGARTGLYAIPVPTRSRTNAGCLRDSYHKAGLRNLERNLINGLGYEGEIERVSDFSNKKIYEVKDGMISVKGIQYSVKLADGFYIIRKFSVAECCRLQTLPDDYCRAVSNTQAYKGLGNGWTAEVIIHLLNHALKDVPRDTPLKVLSMYDGIGTGRYCLDKMGFKNVTYYAYEIDKFAIKVAMSNYSDIIQMGDAFQVRNESEKEKWEEI